MQSDVAACSDGTGRITTRARGGIEGIRQEIAASLSTPASAAAAANGQLTNAFYSEIGFSTAEAVTCYLSLSSSTRGNLRIDAVARQWIDLSKNVHATDPKTGIDV
jgi:hypothetical protein